MNGEAMNPDGCLVTLVWKGTGPQSSVVEVKIVSMLTEKLYLTWQQAGVRSVTAVEMHLQYAAVAFDASDTIIASASTPSIALFSIYGTVPNMPIATYSTHTMNAHGLDLVVLPFAQPAGSKTTVMPNTDQVFIAAVDEGVATLLYTTAPSQLLRPPPPSLSMNSQLACECTHSILARS